MLSQQQVPQALNSRVQLVPTLWIHRTSLVLSLRILLARVWTVNFAIIFMILQPKSSAILLLLGSPLRSHLFTVSKSMDVILCLRECCRGRQILRPLGSNVHNSMDDSSDGVLHLHLWSGILTANSLRTYRLHTWSSDFVFCPGRSDPLLFGPL